MIVANNSLLVLVIVVIGVHWMTECSLQSILINKHLSTLTRVDESVDGSVDGSVELTRSSMDDAIFFITCQPESQQKKKNVNTPHISN